MRAIFIDKPGKVVLRECDEPIPGDGEVLIRVTAAGICGTDLHLYEGAFGEFPAIPGHDVAGVIVGAGPGVDEGRIGERVTVDPAGCCARSATTVELCPACLLGNTHICRDATYMGMSAPGAMAEKIVVPAARAIKLTPDISDEMATVLEPVVVALHLQEKIADRPGDAFIIGGGPIGILAGLILRADQRRIILSEPMENRRQLAKDLGIRDVVHPRDIQSELNVDLIVETSGHPSSTETMVNAAKKGATIVLVGGSTEIPAIVILQRELEVRAAKGGRGLYPEAIQLVTANKIPLKSIISHRFPVEKAAEAFQSTLTRREEITRSVIDMTEW